MMSKSGYVTSNCTQQTQGRSTALHLLACKQTRCSRHTADQHKRQRQGICHIMEQALRPTGTCCNCFLQLFQCVFMIGWSAAIMCRSPAAVLNSPCCLLIQTFHNSCLPACLLLLLLLAAAQQRFRLHCSRRNMQRRHIPGKSLAGSQRLAVGVLVHPSRATASCFVQKPTILHQTVVQKRPIGVNLQTAAADRGSTPGPLVRTQWVRPALLACAALRE
jgi:hypothetical protein